MDSKKVGDSRYHVHHDKTLPPLVMGSATFLVTLYHHQVTEGNQMVATYHCEVTYQHHTVVFVTIG